MEEDLLNTEIFEIEPLVVENAIEECYFGDDDVILNIDEDVDVVMPRFTNFSKGFIKVEKAASVAQKSPYSIKFNCQLCNTRFPTQRRLYNHYESKHGKYITVLLLLCGNQFVFF